MMKLHVCNLWCNHEKIQGLDAAFLVVEISEYVEYLSHISSEYFTSCWHVLLACIIPWTSKYLVLYMYIARIRVV
jgi:hypothetical protein